MAISGDRDFLSIPIVTINDFSAVDKLGRAVTRLGEFADNGDEAFGICMEQVTSGHTMKVGVWGILKYRPINVVSDGYKLTVTTSGFFQAAAADTTAVGNAIGQSGIDFADTTSAAFATGMFSFFAKQFIDALSGGSLVDG